jgi:hypothetical protein
MANCSAPAASKTDHSYRLASRRKRLLFSLGARGEATREGRREDWCEHIKFAETPVK